MIGGSLDGGEARVILRPVSGTASPYDPINPEDVERGRLLAAVAYLPALCFLGLLGAPENAYVHFHARQGFLLLLVELIFAVFFGIYDLTLGQIPWVGPILGYIVKFLVWTSLLVITVVAAARASTGDMTKLPYLGDYIEKVPF